MSDKAHTDGVASTFLFAEDDCAVAALGALAYKTATAATETTTRVNAASKTFEVDDDIS